MGTGYAIACSAAAADRSCSPLVARWCGCRQVTHSSTYILDKVYGWSGVCVEPTASSRKALSVRSCSVVTAVVSGDDGAVAPFVTDTGTDSGGSFSGLVGHLDHGVDPASFGSSLVHAQRHPASHSAVPILTVTARRLLLCSQGPLAPLKQSRSRRCWTMCRLPAT